MFAEALGGSVATKIDLAELKADLKADIAAIRGDMGTLKWMMGVLIALAIANFAKQFF